MSLSNAFNAPTVPSAEAPQKCCNKHQTPNTAKQALLAWDRFCPKIKHLNKPNSANFLQDERVTYAVQHCSQRAFCSEMSTSNFKDWCSSNTFKKHHLRSESLRSHSQDPRRIFPKMNLFSAAVLKIQLSLLLHCDRYNWVIPETPLKANRFWNNLKQVTKNPFHYSIHFSTNFFRQ